MLQKPLFKIITIACLLIGATSLSTAQARLTPRQLAERNELMVFSIKNDTLVLRIKNQEAILSDLQKNPTYKKLSPAKIKAIENVLKPLQEYREICEANGKRIKAEVTRRKTSPGSPELTPDEAYEILGKDLDGLEENYDIHTKKSDTLDALITEIKGKIPTSTPAATMPANTPASTTPTR